MKTSQKAQGLKNIRSLKNMKTARSANIWAIPNALRKDQNIYALIKKREMLREELRALKKRMSVVEKELNSIDGQIKDLKETRG